MAGVDRAAGPCTVARIMADVSDSPFPATRWSLVQRVREPAAREAAMEELCRLYWRPIYLYARRSGHSQEDAEDLTQSFFASLIERDTFAGADEQRGKLRTLLLTAFQRFAVSQWRKENRSKRGGGLHFTGIEELENSPALASNEAPDAAYDRAWAAAIVGETEAALARDYEARGRGELYRRLQPMLAWNSTPDGTAAAVADECGLTPGAVRVALKRLRDAWRRGIEQAVASTVSGGDDAAEEVRWLFKMWAAE